MYYYIKVFQKYKATDLENYFNSAIKEEFIFEEISDYLFLITSQVCLRNEFLQIKDLLSFDIAKVRILSSPINSNEISHLTNFLENYTQELYISLADFLLISIIGNCYESKIILQNLFKNIDNELLKTIIFFIKNSSSVVDTAKKLYLHRNTLNYKILKFEDQSQMSIRNIECQNLIYIYSVIHH